MTEPNKSNKPNRAKKPNEPAWYDADRKHVWHPYTQMATAPPPIPIARAEGVWLETPDGRKILDAISSWWVNIHGHNHPRLNQALSEQASRLAQVIFAGFTHEPAARLAAALVERAPGSMPRVFFSDDGSTAVEVAMKIAYQSWRHRGQPQRNLFVALEHAYHGDTFGAMAAGGTSTFHTAFADLFCEVRRVRAACCSEDREISCGGQASPSLEEVLKKEGHRVAAVLIEPMIQGAGGMKIAPPAFLAEVRQLTKRHGVPMIADEIFTGFARSGRFFACEHAAVEPDLLCTSKALTGGYLPLAATLVSEDLYDTFLSEDRNRTLFHGHSYSGNALACAVALEGLSIFDDEECLDRVQRLDSQYAELLAGLQDHPAVAETRHLGAVAALELRPRTQAGYLDDLGPRLYAAFLERNLLLRPLGNVIYVLPPYPIQDQQVEQIFGHIREVLDRL